MSAPRVAVVGGGLAGLTAALACADAGARVALFEARARLGGATWSTAHRGLEIDNGQHVFLRCCEAYLGLLCAPRRARPRRAAGAPGGAGREPRPAAGLDPARRAAGARASGAQPARPSTTCRSRRACARRWSARRISALDPEDPALDGISLGDWLAQRGESDAAIDGLWDLLVRATLESPGARGLARARGEGAAHRLPRPRRRRRPRLADGAARAAARGAGGGGAAKGRRGAASARVRRRDRVCSGTRALRCGSEARCLEVDALILATDHEAAARLAPPAAGLAASALAALGRSPIVNLHVVLDRPVLDLPLPGGLRHAAPVDLRPHARRGSRRGPGAGGLALRRRRLAASLERGAARRLRAGVRAPAARGAVGARRRLLRDLRAGGHLPPGAGHAAAAPARRARAARASIWRARGPPPAGRPRWRARCAAAGRPRRPRSPTCACRALGRPPDAGPRARGRRARRALPRARPAALAPAPDRLLEGASSRPT